MTTRGGSPPDGPGSDSVGGGGPGAGGPPDADAADTADDGVLDPGLQHERTELAWDRTALSLMVVGALCVRIAVTSLGVAWAGPGLLVVGAGAGVLWLGVRHSRRRVASLRAAGSPVRPADLTSLGAAALGASLVALVLAVAVLVTAA